MVVLLFTKRTNNKQTNKQGKKKRKERKEKSAITVIWGVDQCQEISKLSTHAFFNLSLCLQHFLCLFFSQQNHCTSCYIPCGMDIRIWEQSVGSESNAGTWNCTWSLAGACVGEKSWWNVAFFPRNYYLMWSRLVQIRVDCIFTQQNEHWDCILEHLSNHLSNVDLFPFLTLWLSSAVWCLLFNLTG